VGAAAAVWVGEGEAGEGCCVAVEEVLGEDEWVRVGGVWGFARRWHIVIDYIDYIDWV
jgi:hypothetical protein